MNFKKAVGVGCSLALAVSLAAVLPANSVARAGDVEEVAALVQDVAPYQADVVVPGLGEDGTYSSEENPSFLPVDPSASISVSSESGTALSVALPVGLSLNDGQLAPDGTVVYTSDAGGTDVAAQLLDDGSVRVQTIINNATDGHEFEYRMQENFLPVAGDDGSIWIVGFNENEEFEAYSVDPAWAKDASGADVATRYEVRGNSLVQIVEPSESTIYPVVADPTWLWYNGAYGAGFSKKETANLASLTAAGAFCSAVPAGALRAACFISFGYFFLQATLAKNAGGCVFLAAAPAPIALRWLSSACK